MAAIFSTGPACLADCVLDLPEQGSGRSVMFIKSSKEARRACNSCVQDAACSETIGTRQTSASFVSYFPECFCNRLFPVCTCAPLPDPFHFKTGERRRPPLDVSSGRASTGRVTSEVPTRTDIIIILLLYIIYNIYYIYINIY